MFLDHILVCPKLFLRKTGDVRPYAGWEQKVRRMEAASCISLFNVKLYGTVVLDFRMNNLSLVRQLYKRVHHVLHSFPAIDLANMIVTKVTINPIPASGGNPECFDV